MIYLTIIGQCEAGRGETLQDAIVDAKQYGFDIKIDDVVRHQNGYPVMDGSIIWDYEPYAGH